MSYRCQWRLRFVLKTSELWHLQVVTNMSEEPNAFIYSDEASSSFLTNSGSYLRTYPPDSHTLIVLKSLSSKYILIIRISEVILLVFIQSANFERGD